MATEVVEPTYEEEVVEVAAAPIVSAELPDIKLFGRWSCDEVQVSDMSLQVRYRMIFFQLDLIDFIYLCCF